MQLSCSLDGIGLFSLILEPHLVHVRKDRDGLTSLTEVRSRVVFCGIGQSFSIFIDLTTETMLVAQCR